MVCFSWVKNLLLLLSISAPSTLAEEFDDLARWLPGRYDTFAQAAADESANSGYRHVRAELRILRLADGAIGMEASQAVFYLEQSLAGQPPYRQRILVLARDAVGIAELLDYKILDPGDVAGADLKTIEGLSPSRLARESGCEVRWIRVDTHLFKGSAGASRSCRSALRGATHVISYSELTPTTLTSLDQGFDDSGAHKWGPPPGVVGHIFRKQPSN
jgi:hypothetical protein